MQNVSCDNEAFDFEPAKRRCPWAAVIAKAEGGLVHSESLGTFLGGW